MKDFVVLTDSTCDLPESFQKEYGIIVLPGHVVLPDGKEILQTPKWEHFTKEEFYKSLKKNPDGYKTSPANVAEIKAKMEAETAAGRGVIMITISSAISGSPEFARQAMTLVKEANPQAEIAVVDSLRFGPGLGLMCMYASMKRSEGLSMKETVAWLEENKGRFHQAGWLDDLTFVAKKGRLTHAKAFFGTLAGVKPIGEFDYNGLTTVLGKAAGAKAAYEVLLQYMAETIENPEEQIIMIAETFRYPQAEAYKTMIEEKFHPKAVYIQDVYPSCGVNIGPGLMAAYYVGKPISKDLSEERAIIEKALSSGK
ncbi:MAG: DegV family protein [Lachnospiraceae bacterium]|nr:DegV family protein [Lachnospiraceae bacterium]